MTTQDHKQLAVQFFAQLSAGDIPGALSLMTDDATWWASGKPELLPAAGTYDKARLQRLFNRMWRELPAGLAMTVKAMIAEGDHLAAEVESTGDLKNGRAYRQQYHFAIAFRDGKIASVREYLDTHHAFDVWVRP